MAPVSERGRLDRIARVPAAEILDRPTTRPRVTVVIPNYNYARFLPDSIGSALAQADVEVDVVVVDDASTDDSAAVLRRIAQSEPRVLPVLSDRNRGAVGTFNAGLERATGEWIVRLDADDLLTPGSLARATALGEAFPNVGLIYGRPLHFHGDPPSVPAARPSHWTVWAGGEWLELRCRLGVNCITSPEAVMRAGDVQKIGGQRDDLPHAHDMEMWLRLATVCDVGHVDGVVQALHREHADSLSAVHVDVIGDLHHRSDVFEKLLEQGGERERRLLGSARSALAEEALGRAAQAYAAGRGGTPETDGYLDFAREQGVDLGALPSSRAVERAQRLGPKRAHLWPPLLARAAIVRARSRAAVARTLRTGI